MCNSFAIIVTVFLGVISTSTNLQVPSQETILQHYKYCISYTRALQVTPKCIISTDPLFLMFYCNYLGLSTRVRYLVICYRIHTNELQKWLAYLFEHKRIALVEV